ncbi:MAG: hypothetical protein AUJ75_02610 [Candidatus Omnitrophica bacterium CG1_02_49_10]|nr:MAG: hypothetical protein AUJ75_02610 [Candidatus Omnitrophica bacterium CG1_02_49_10]
MVASGPHGFRAVLDGRFTIDKDNAVTYNIKRPAGISPDADIPHRIKIEGKWSLDEDHNVNFIVDHSSDIRFGEDILLSGEILSASSGSLLLSVKTGYKGGATVRTYRLRGKWQTDYDNRITFIADRSAGGHDMLTLGGAWDVNKRHHIIYKYKKRIPGGKKSSERTIHFNGYWDVARSGSLLYVMDLKNDSLFDFRIGIGIPEFRGGRSLMKYEVGIGISKRKRPFKRLVKLYGVWKLSRNGKIRFEIGYAEGRVESIDFDTEVKLKDKYMVNLRLKDMLGDDLGINLTFTRDMIDGKGYVRLEHAPREWKVLGGIYSRW